MENHEINFDLGCSNYSRTKEVSVFQGQCDKCGYGQRVIISTDSSSGEYGSVDICVSCIDEMSDLFKEEQTK